MGAVDEQVPAREKPSARQWGKLSRLQIGVIGESCAKIAYIMLGYDVYPTAVDEKGIDFVAIKDGDLHYVQVKSVRRDKHGRYSYTFIRKSLMPLDDEHEVCLVRFEDGEDPHVYVIPATAWDNPECGLSVRNYDKKGQKSKPEYGISYPNGKKAAEFDRRYEVFSPLSTMQA